MTDFSPNLSLPYLMPSQAQKHVTVNDALRQLDMLVQTTLVSATLQTEPVAPVEGAVYVLPPGKTGVAWSTMPDHALAQFADGTWIATPPRTGWQAFAIDTSTPLLFDGQLWRMAGAYRGALIEMTANQAVSASAHTSLNFGASVRNLAGWFAAQYPSRLTVPSGVTRARVRANAAFAPHAIGTRSLRVLKNGASFKGMPFVRTASAGASLWTVLSLSSGVIDTQAGDYFEVSVFQDSGTNLQVFKDDTTWFEIEACA